MDADEDAQARTPPLSLFLAYAVMVKFSPAPSSHYRPRPPLLR